MITALSLFSGVGGLDLAASALGIRVQLATDVDVEALQVLWRGLGTTTLAGDIGDLLTDGALAERWCEKDNPTLIFGGPPCTPFSHAGFWIDEKRNGKDPASALLGRFSQAVELFRPQAFLLENVPGLAFKTHRVTLDSFRTRMRQAGYTLTEQVLSAAAFSVPQRRRRLFVVGIMNGVAARLSEWPSFPTRSAGDALNGMTSSPAEPDEAIRGEYSDLLNRVPPGGNYLHFTERYGCDPPVFKNRGRYWSFLLKIDPALPAPTVPAQRVTYNGPFHWESRHLRVREIARLQGFPDGYPMAATRSVARRHLGNAVPPALGMAVLWRLLASLDLSDAVKPPVALEEWTDSSSSYASALRALGARAGLLSDVIG